MVFLERLRVVDCSSTLPLLVAAFNLHKRLRLILDDGHAYRAFHRAGSKARSIHRQLP